MAGGLPAAVHEVRARRRAEDARPGRVRRGRHSADPARPGRRHDRVGQGRSKEKQALAENIGAHRTLETGEELPRMVDAVFDTAGAATWAHSIASARPGGTVLTCGATTGPTPKTPLRALFRDQIDVRGSYLGTREEMVTMISFIETTGIRPVIGRTLPDGGGSGGLLRHVARQDRGEDRAHALSGTLDRRRPMRDFPRGPTACSGPDVGLSPPCPRSVRPRAVRSPGWTPRSTRRPASAWRGRSPG